MKTKVYPSDLTDAQWELIRQLLPNPSKVGRPQTLDMRDVLNAIFYITRSGCQWRMLPGDFPSWQSVYHHFQKWTEDGTLKTIHDVLVEKVREVEKPQPRTTAAVDSQTTDSHGARQDRGVDGGKLLEGRKRHLIIDSLGLILSVVITAANVADCVGGKKCLNRLDPEKFPNLDTFYGDKAFGKGGFPEEVARFREGCKLTTISKPEGVKGFVRLPIRWMAERTNAWVTKSRRLCRSYEHNSDSEESMIYVAMISRMARRLSPHSKQQTFGFKRPSKLGVE